MSWHKGVVATQSTQGDVAQSGTTTIVSAPPSGYLIIRTLVVSADTDGSAALKSGATRRGPKFFYSANGGVAVEDMNITLNPQEAFNVTWTGGGNVSYYCEYQLIPNLTP